MDMNLLTSVELHIAQRIADGDLDKEIARDVGVSCDALRQRLCILRQKIGAHNRAMVAAWYVRHTEVRQ